MGGSENIEELKRGTACSPPKKLEGAQRATYYRTVPQILDSVRHAGGRGERGGGVGFK